VKCVNASKTVQRVLLLTLKDYALIATVIQWESEMK